MHSTTEHDLSHIKKRAIVLRQKLIVSRTRNPQTMPRITCARSSYMLADECTCPISPKRVVHIGPSATYYPQSSMCRVDNDLVSLSKHCMWGNCFCREILEKTQGPSCARVTSFKDVINDEITLMLCYKECREDPASVLCYYMDMPPRPNRHPLAMLVRIQRAVRRFLGTRRAKRRLALLMGFVIPRLGSASLLCTILPLDLILQRSIGA